MTFSAAQQVSSNQGGQTWQVKLDDKVIGEVSPEQSATTYTSYLVKFTSTSTRQVL